MSLPVVVLTGFLGAGKTTLLRQILAERNDTRIGVVLNEIGAAGIDAVSALAFKEITDACACCVRSDDFVAAMAEMAARADLDLVLLETTGTADPLPIMWRLEAIPTITLECVVTAVDVATPQMYARDEWIAQVQAADWVVLTKTDLGASDEAMAAVARMQPNARFITAAQLPDALISRPTDLRERALPTFHLARHSRLHGVVVREADTFAIDAIEKIFEELPAAIVRAKAIVRVADGWVGLQRVGSRMHTELDVPAPSHGESRFAFFADALDEAALRATLAQAKLTQ